MKKPLLFPTALFIGTFYLSAMEQLEIHYGAQAEEDLGQSIYYDAEDHQDHPRVQGEDPKPVVMTFERYDLIPELKKTIKEKDEVIKKQEQTIFELEKKIKQLQHNNLRNTQ